MKKLLLFVIACVLFLVTSIFADEINLKLKKKVCRYLITEVRDYVETDEEFTNCVKECVKGSFTAKYDSFRKSYEIDFEGKLLPNQSNYEKCNVALYGDLNSKVMNGYCELIYE
jgi:hypothetical protein